MNVDEIKAAMSQAAKCPCFKCRHRLVCEIECEEYSFYLNPYPAMQRARKQRIKAALQEQSEQ